MQLTVYKASAGSGKTFTLTVQYIRLLLSQPDGSEFRHILGVTFTNKAVAEMKDRILGQLYGIANALPSSDSYLHAVQAAMAADGCEVPPESRLRAQCGRVLQQILHDYGHFRVLTIDSFFQTVVRSLAHELGLTANLQVDINDKEVLSQAVDNIIDRLDCEPRVLMLMQSFIRDRIEESQKWDVTEMVKKFGCHIFDEFYMLYGDKLESFLSDAGKVAALKKQLQAIVHSSKAAVMELGRRLMACMQQHGVSLDDFSNGPKNYGGMLRKLTEGDMDITLGQSVLKAAADPLTLVRKADQKKRPELMDAADSVADCFTMIIEELPKAQRDYATARGVLAHLYPLCLLSVIDQEVAAINRDTARYTLAKTPILLHQMIGTSDSPFVFEKIGAQLHHVMIDEFQDTSHLQWTNFQTLLLESASRGGFNMLVGDVKQSIYRWRGGDWRILGTLGEDGKDSIKVETLGTNFRSERRVVEFNNRFFTEAAMLLDALQEEDERTLGCTGMTAQAYADVAQVVPENRPDGGYVAVTLVGKDEDGEQTQQRVLASVKQRVRELLAAGLPPSEITILVRRHGDANPLIRSFAEEADLPALASAEAFVLGASTALALLMAAIKLLVDDSDVISSFLLDKHGADVAQLKADSSQMRLMPLMDLVYHLHSRLRLAELPGQEAYVMAFIDYVMSYTTEQAGDLFSFIAYWDNVLCRQKVPAARADGISIITIHAAKGLEFHTVLIPFCDWSFDLSHQDQADTIWAQPKEEPYTELGILPVTAGSRLSRMSAFNKEVADDVLQRHLDELNAMYVAFTRARTNLYIWSQTSDSRGKTISAGRLVQEVVHTMYPDTEVSDMTLYESGHPATCTASAMSTSSNPLLPVWQPLDVGLESYSMSASFKQSNMAQEFFASLSENVDVPQPQATGKAQSYLEQGRLLHRFFQSIVTMDDVPRVLADFEVQGLITSAATADPATAIHRSRLMQWVQRGLSDPLVASWFAGGNELYNECNIISRDADGRIVTHRPDRVIVSPDKRHVTIVDYKFGTPRDEYLLQVRTYIALMQQLYPEASVDAYLWYVYSGRVEQVAP